MTNQIKVEDLVPYALGGKASFTIKVNGLYHFKINSKLGEVWFVYVSLNTNDWYYFGHINKKQQLVQDYKSEVKEDDKAALCLKYVWTKALSQSPNDGILIWHDGICSRCHLQLTDEESVRRGLGPTCYLLV